MTADEAIALLHQILNVSDPKNRLNDTQIKVFRLIWLGKPYLTIAEATSYEYEYVKQVSSKLWQLLSKALNQPVSKRNLQTVFQQYAQNQIEVQPAPLLDLPQGMMQNLPVANYSALIGRTAETDRLLRFLSFEHPTHCISIEGLGGIGKTTLALSIAYRLQQSPGAFDAIIFASAKSHRLTSAGVLPRLQPDRNLQDIFRAIAHTLQCPDLLLQPFEQQLTQIQVRLSRQRTLLVIDNLETVEDWRSILAFLYDLPITVKVLLTSRQQTPFPAIALSPLLRAESVNLIQNQFHSKGLDLSATVIEQLHHQTCGIPAAIVYAVGLVASGYSIESSAVSTSDYARFYFGSSVMTLKNSAAYHLFMAFALFPGSAVPEAIAYVADVDLQIVTQGLAKLQQLSLISQQAGRYDMLPLTRDYAIGELETDADLKARAYQRRVEWYLRFAETHGSKDWTDWQNYGPLEQEWSNLQEVIEWCIAGDRYTEVCQFWQKVRCYSHTQGYRSSRLTCWATRLDWTDWLIQAAEQRQDSAMAADVLFDRAWTLTLLGQPHHLEAAESLFARAWEYRHYTNLPFQIDLALHIAVWRIQQQQFSEAALWLQATEIMLQTASSIDKTVHQRLSTQWHYYQGEIAYKTESYAEAQGYFRQVLHQAEALDWRRVIFLAKDWLADIALKQGNLAEARQLMLAGLQVAQAHHDACRTAFCMRSMARLEQIQGNRAVARNWAEDAKRLFEQLGMRAEAGETIELLQQFG
ncbi:MAG TPA: NB-ARC domain-containing protein [Trichocoleus sp.]|jgi:LuxR family glucitol operon transcriptional activator